MPKDAREPQSYGSNEDWVTGRTGEQVNPPKAAPPPGDPFYESRRDAETTEPQQGGENSPFNLAENVEPEGKATPDETQPIAKVTGREGGAKRGSFFKRRDYD